MNYTLINDLRSVYLLNNKQALHGKTIIDSFQKENDAKGLMNILRHHEEKDITNAETWVRDDIDYFLEYFSILSLGHITGYLSYEELQVSGPEIAYYLGNASVKRYYYINYPLLLPQVLLEVLVGSKPFTQSASTEKEANQFHQFHALNQTIDNDDVNQFLWFLDGGENDGYDIDNLKATLKRPKTCMQILEQKPKHALGQSLRGFFKYLDFLASFDLFLAEIKNGNHAAAYWYYHQYWFKQIKHRLHSTIIHFHNGLHLYLAESSRSAQVEGDEKLSKLSQKVPFIFDKIEDSKHQYLQLLDRLVFTSVYEERFAAQVKEWRDGKSK